MDVNSEGIYETRPWKIFGEGPVAEASNPIRYQGFNEGRHRPYTVNDIRFVTKGDVLYAHVMAWPEDGKVIIRSLSEGNPLIQSEISSVEMIGTNAPVNFERTVEGLVVELPNDVTINNISLLLKINSL